MTTRHVHRSDDWFDNHMRVVNVLVALLFAGLVTGAIWAICTFLGLDPFTAGSMFGVTAATAWLGLPAGRR